MKNIKAVSSLFVVASLIFSSVGNAIACTTILITDKNGNAYKARTMEFSVKFPSQLTYLPAGTKIESATPDGKPGMSFNTKYPVLGMTVQAVSTAKQPALVDGMNDQGLTFSANAFYNSSTAPISGNASNTLSVADFGNWIIGNFKSVAELKDVLSSTSPQFWLPVTPVMGNVPFPAHYAIFDKKGEGIVIEFMNNKINVYDNPVGVMANGPEFPWHLTNLNNYTQSNVDKNTGQLGKLKLSTPDAGIALTALPSSQTSPGRFVKAAFYANYVRKASTPDGAIITLGHIINNFDRPHDLTVDAAGGFGDGPRDKVSSEVTDWTVMNDTARNLYYIRTIDALNWTSLDLAKLKNVSQTKSISTYDIQRAGADAFTLFYK